MVRVETACQMRDATIDAAKEADVVVAAAAVADYMPASFSESKIKSHRASVLWSSRARLISWPSWGVQRESAYSWVLLLKQMTCSPMLSETLFKKIST